MLGVAASAASHLRPLLIVSRLNKIQDSRYKFKISSTVERLLPIHSCSVLLNINTKTTTISNGT